MCVCAKNKGDPKISVCSPQVCESFAFSVRRIFMVRRGWSAVATPAGWYEIIRGPRPPSVQWPKGKGKGNQDVQQRAEASGPRPGGARFSGGLWNRGDSQRSTKIRSLGGALAALGPEDSSAKTELEGALKRAKAQESTPTRVDPDARVGAARDRVARLEQAISAMGNSQGPKMDVSGDASGSTDQSPRSFHRTGQEEDRTNRPRARSRSSEIGGESETLRGIPGHGSCPASCTTAGRCQCRGEPTPADGVGFATTVAGASGTLGRLSIPKLKKRGLRSRHRAGGLGVVGRPTG